MVNPSKEEIYDILTFLWYKPTFQIRDELAKLHKVPIQRVSLGYLSKLHQLEREGLAEHRSREPTPEELKEHPFHNPIHEYRKLETGKRAEVPTIGGLEGVLSPA